VGDEEVTALYETCSWSKHGILDDEKKALFGVFWCAFGSDGAPFRCVEVMVKSGPIRITSDEICVGLMS
jgi:hypothetical protein